MKKCILIVIDSLGVGAAPDAKKYGDEESNTFGNVSRVNGKLNLPTFNTSSQLLHVTCCILSPEYFILAYLLR